MPEAISSQPPVLISDEYRKMQQKMHENPEYGKASLGYVEVVADVISRTGVNEMLDYGAGKGRLAQALKDHIKRPLRVFQYDPAIPEWSAPPQPCQLVVCIDVLEHIEPSLIENVLDDLKRVTQGAGVFTIHTGPALKVLPDGRNAHLIQRPPDWWLPQILQRFDLVNFARYGNGFMVLVERKQS
jgi:Methyltransferase domain